MKITIALVLSLAWSSSLGQEHATSIEQCRADLNLWRSQITDYLNADTNRINNNVPNNTEVMKLTFTQLNARAYELGQCAVIDPDNEESYNDNAGAYNNARNDRYKFFVERHKLKKQMLAEDAAGRRTQ